MRSTRTFSAALLLTFVGMAMPLAASADQPPRDPNTQGTSARIPGGTSFVSGDKIRGMSVKNSADESMGSITDFIIERGSGRVAYIVLKTGATLGIGGKSVVVPYSAFGWDNADKHATLSGTPEQAKAWPEFDADLWQLRDKQDNALVRTLSTQYYKNSSDASYPNSGAEDQHLKGRVTRITRVSTPGAADRTILTVTTDDGRTEKVLIGPTWYLSGSSAPIYRDAPVDLYVARARDGDAQWVARRMSSNSRETRFYDDKGNVMWGQRANAQPGASHITPFILGSELDGKTVHCRGDQSGSVNDLIVECVSGRVAFLSIDPNENVMGIADTKRLVPWSIVVATTPEVVMLDASKAMITSAEKTPSDLHTLSTANTYRSAYPGFDVPVESFEPVRP